MKAPNVDGFCPLSRFEDVEGGLHADERFHFWAERLFDSDGHVARQICFRVEEAGEGLSRYSEGDGGAGDCQTERLDDCGSNDFTWMRWV